MKKSELRKLIREEIRNITEFNKHELETDTNADRKYIRSIASFSDKMLKHELSILQKKSYHGMRTLSKSDVWKKKYLKMLINSNQKSDI